MSRKKAFLLLVSLVFMMSLFANFAAAQQTFMPEIIEKFAKFLFLDLGDMTKSAPDTFVIYSKFLFFLLVFTVLFWGAQKVFKEQKNIAGTIAFLFAVISTVLLPKALMIFIFESYSVVIGFFFAFLPFIIGFVIAHRAVGGDEKWKRILRAIIYIAIAVFTFSFVGTLRGFDNPLYIEMAKWAEVGGFIALIVGIFALIGSIGGGGGGGGGGWNPFGGGGTPEERAERREEAERRKEERDEKGEAAADAAVMKLTSEMEQVEKKLQNIESEEVALILQSLKKYENHREILAKVKEGLIGTWNVDVELGNLMRELKNYPQYYKEKMPEIQEKIELYKRFVSRLIEIISALKNSLEKQESIDKNMKKLEKYDKRLVYLLKKGDRVEKRDLKAISKLEEREKKENEEIESLGKKIKKMPKIQTKKEMEKQGRIEEARVRIEQIKALQNKRDQLLDNEIKAIKSQFKADKQIRRLIGEGANMLEKIKELDAKDIKTCENTIKFISKYGLRATASEIWKLKGRILLLRDADIRQVYERVDDLRKDTEEKITLSNDYKQIKVKENQVANFVKNISDYILKAEKYAEAINMGDLERLEQAKID